MAGKKKVSKKKVSKKKVAKKTNTEKIEEAVSVEAATRQKMRDFADKQARDFNKRFASK